MHWHLADRSKLFQGLEGYTTINKGKSSGFRLIYAHFEGEQYDAAIAISLYCKQNVDKISDQELARLILEAHVVLANMAPPVFKAQEVKQQT